MLKKNMTTIKNNFIIKCHLLLAFLFLCNACFAQQKNNVSQVWVADNKNGTFKNPIIHADYSDPDAIRVGDDYYMVSSSFTQVPGLPILHSKDLVNWTLIGHALKKLIPEEHFNIVQHGGGVWAPSIRFHKNEFYIYYPDPDFGIYLVKAKNISGPWTEPILVQEGKGLIDPCPLWDDDGKVYLVHAYAGSRAGIKSIIVIKEMNATGTKTITDAVMVYDGHENDATIEGPKFYKRNNWYYIFAPAGGVSTGWQIVLRSKNIYGPYERKIVLEQGATSINGPHQGAWLQTQKREDWFLHFQDKDAYGRVVHLQPMKWINDWPVIGIDENNDGKGEPVLTYKKPNVGKTYPIETVAESDEFNLPKLGLQWQWQANPKEGWAFATSQGFLRMFSVYQVDSIKNSFYLPNILGQKFPAENFMATTKFSLKLKQVGDKFGLIVVGLDEANISIIKKEDGNYISFATCENADKGSTEKNIDIEKLSDAKDFYLRVKVLDKALCEFSFSTDGKTFKLVEKKFIAKPGKWVGARVGLFSTSNKKINDNGYADVDWFRIEKQ
jgi:beta-xylosidase